MKSILIASVLSLTTLSLSGTAYADAGHSHGASKEKHAMENEHAAAFGKPGEAAKVSRTMTVDMNDTMKFFPEKLNVRKGETIRFIVKNSGKIKHEMVLGSMKELKEHAAMMKKTPEMEHADENMVAVDPGKTGEIIWQFTKAGTFDFACLQPGHFEAGMKGMVTVADIKGKVTADKTPQHGASVPANAVIQAGQSSAIVGAAMSDGEVRKIDKEAGKVTIKHGPLANLEMPAMTMVFRVKDLSLLDQVKTGDKISFIAEKVNGQFMVTQLEVKK